ncbi:MAG: hypothetical protein QM680_13460 [Luteolibacter sp.]
MMDSSHIFQVSMILQQMPSQSLIMRDHAMVLETEPADSKGKSIVSMMRLSYFPANLARLALKSPVSDCIPNGAACFVFFRELLSVRFLHLLRWPSAIRACL